MNNCYNVQYKIGTSRIIIRVGVTKSISDAGYCDWCHRSVVCPSARLSVCTLKPLSRMRCHVAAGHSCACRWDNRVQRWVESCSLRRPAAAAAMTSESRATMMTSSQHYVPRLQLLRRFVDLRTFIVRSRTLLHRCTDRV